MEELYFNPTEDQARFLTKFVISSQKIDLYGFPPLTALKSELIKSLQDKLSPGATYELATNIPLKSEKALKSVWLFLNADTFDNLDGKDQLEMWPWFNYFDVDIKNSKILTVLQNYLLKLNYLYFDDLVKSEYLDDMLSKAKVILPRFISDFDRKHNNIALIIDGGRYRFDLDKRNRLEDELKKIPELEVTHLIYWSKDDQYYILSRMVRRGKWESEGYKRGTGPVIKYKDEYYTYPEFDKDLGRYFSDPITNMTR